MTETDNRMTPPLEGDGVPTSTTGSNAAITGVATVTQKPESNSPGDKPTVPTAEPPTGERKIVVINTPATLKSWASKAQPILVVAEEHRAKVAASNGHPWSVGRPCLDSRGSSKYGLSLTAGLRVLGVGHLNRGDLVDLEIGRGGTLYRLCSFATRPTTVFLRKTDLAQAGIAELHTPFEYVVLKVTPGSQVEGGQP